MAAVTGQASSLYYRLRVLRLVLPLASCLVGLGYEIVEHEVLTHHALSPAGLIEIVFFTIAGPLLIFFLLTWLLNRVAERDAAEARLAALYHVGRECAVAPGIDELQEIALSLPERARLAGALSVLLVQEAPEGHWLLAGVRGFSAADKVAIETALASMQTRSDCLLPHPDSPTLKPDCPLLAGLRVPDAQGPELMLGLSLSREPSRRVILGVWMPTGTVVGPQAIETLESMAASLTLALDKASYHRHQRQLLQQVGRDIMEEELGLVPALARILADIAAEHPISAGAVYLLNADDDGRKLTCSASWPDLEAGALLSDRALDIVRARGAPPPNTDEAERLSEPVQPAGGVIALPITSEGVQFGVLVLAGESVAWLPHRSILAIVTGMMALLIRNSQLYARLESQVVMEERSYLAREVHDGVAQALAFFNIKVQQVQRLLNRGDVAAATIALQELLTGSHEVYDEVRQLIKDLNEAVVEVEVESTGLVSQLQKYCALFAERTGLRVSVDAPTDVGLTLEIQAELFRVVREALNNVQRHAHAHNVSVQLCKEQARVILIVSDDGTGLSRDRQPGDHFGLPMMRERVRSIGGDLQVDSRSGGGTSLQVTVPLATESRRAREERWSAFVS